MRARVPVEMSCLQCHQVTGIHKGVGTDASKQIVAF